MDLATIAMDQGKAREAFLEYRGAVRERHSRVDEEIMQGYKLLASGKQLLTLGDMLRAGGLDEKGLPRLAVCRANAEWCWVTLNWRDGGGEFRSRQHLQSNNTVERVTIPEGTFPAGERNTFNYRAMVPIVPPRLRPRGSLGNYHILWEAEWSLTPPPAPRDPALLRHIGGELYAVVAVWDLTELERAILQGNRTRLP